MTKQEQLEARETETREILTTLRAIVKEHRLGLGGEQLDALVKEYVDTLHRRYSRVRMTVFPPEYLAIQPTLDEVDFITLIDAIVKLQESAANTKHAEMERDRFNAVTVTAVKQNCELKDKIDALTTERDELQATITACEKEVSEVYRTLTNNKFSKMDTQAVYILDDVERRGTGGWLSQLISYILTIRSTNTCEWMELLAEHINEIAEHIGDADRVEFNGDGLTVKKGREQ